MLALCQRRPVPKLNTEYRSSILYKRGQFRKGVHLPSSFSSSVQKNLYMLYDSLAEKNPANEGVKSWLCSSRRSSREAQEGDVKNYPSLLWNIKWTIFLIHLSNLFIKHFTKINTRHEDSSDMSKSTWMLPPNLASIFPISSLNIVHSLHFGGKPLRWHWPTHVVRTQKEVYLILVYHNGNGWSRNVSRASLRTSGNR